MHGYEVNATLEDRKIRDWAPVISLYQEKKAYAHGVRVLQFVPTPELNMDFRGVALKR